MSEILSCKDVFVHYGNRSSPAIAVDRLSLSPSERVALLGLNGSGKTTLLLAIAGLVPFAGSIHVCGVPVQPDRLSDVRTQLGFLFSTPEDQLLLPRVLDDVGFALRRRGVSVSAAADEARRMLNNLESEGLANRSIHQLSQGERHTVALAGALIATPPLLLLDEPTSSLDPPAKRRLAEFLAEQHSSMLIATHDLAFARRACNRFLVLDAGRLCVDTPYACSLHSAWGS